MYSPKLPRIADLNNSMAYLRDKTDGIQLELEALDSISGYAGHLLRSLHLGLWGRDDEMPASIRHERDHLQSIVSKAAVRRGSFLKLLDKIEGGE